MPSPDQKKKELDLIFFNLLWLDPEEEECWNEEYLIFIKIISDMASKHRIEAIVLLSHEEIRKILSEIKAKASKQGTNSPRCLSSDVRSLQIYLKTLQEKGLFSLDSIFDYSSIYELDFRRF